MATWNFTLELWDVWTNEALTFEDKRDEIVRRIRTAPFWGRDDMEWFALQDIALSIQDAANTGEFDREFRWFYDWADKHRVWVATL